MGGTKDSMISGAPRNLTLAEASLVRRAGPPPAEEVGPLPEPTPARLVSPTEAPRGARTFAAAAERAGYRVEVVASHGPLLNAKGSVSRMVSVTSVRCFRPAPPGESPRAEVVAAWSDGSYDMAAGRRADGSTRLASTLAQAKAWLEHGVEGDMPDARDVAKFVARVLGGRLIGVRYQHPVRHVCPVPLSEAAAEDHLLNVHRLAGYSGPGTRQAHDRVHDAGHSSHTHERWPLGEPGAS